MGILMKLGKQKGQNTAEYAIVIAMVIAAAAGVGGLFKNQVQSRVAHELTKIADTEPAGSGTYTINSGSTTSRTGSDTTNVADGGAQNSVSSATIGRTSTETYTAQ